MSLKGKFRLILALSAGGFVVIGAVGLGMERARLISVEKEQSKTLVELAYGIISEQYKLELEGKLTRQQAQQQAIQTVRVMRYGVDGYLWVNDLHPVMVMHPTQPQLEGKDLTEYKDANGTSIFMQMIAKVKTQGAGYVSYTWPRPGWGDTPVPKISYVMGFAPWDWVIGTGVYTGDVMSVWRKKTLIPASFLGLSCLLLLLLVSSRISSSIFGRLDYVVGRMRAIGQAEADLNTPLKIPEVSGFSLSSAGDEITVLVDGINEMLSQIARRDADLQKHQQILEEQVTARTRELMNANAKLANEMMRQLATQVELRKAHDEAEQLLSSIASILIGVDERGVVTRWNAAATASFLIPSEQALGQDFRKLAIAWQQPEIWDRLRSVALSGKSQRVDEVSIRDKDGKLKILGLAVHPIHGDRGQLGGFVLLGVDISQRRNLEEQLRQAQKLEAIGQLAAGIAHEINTPTQFIGDNIRFLRSNWDTLKSVLVDNLAEASAPASSASADHSKSAVNEEMDYLLEEIPKALDQSLDGVARVSRIVAAMREFSHPGSTDKQSADLNRAIDTAITVSRNEWKYVADVKTDFEPGLPFVECMINEFQQVILNVLINSAQAIAEKFGKDASHKGAILVSTRKKDDCVEIRIQDDGGGIPANIRDRVFEPFFTTKPVGKGTGQGLALVHNVIVKKHSGRVWIESEPGQGTTVVIQLPIGDQSSEEAAAEPVSSSVQQ